MRARLHRQHHRRDRRRADRRLRADPGARPAPDLPDRGRHRRARRRGCLAAALARAELTNDERRTHERRTSNAERRTANVVVPAAVAIAAVAAILLLPGWDRELLASGAYKYAPYLGTGDFESRAARRHARLLQGRRGGDGQRPAADRDDVAGDRRQGGRVERRRHADAADARPAAGADPRQRARHLHHRPRQRRDARLGARRPAPSSTPTSSRSRRRWSRRRISSIARTAARWRSPASA